MAKKQSALIQAAKKLPIKPGGQRDWREGLTASQLKEYEELLAWMRAGRPGSDRPTYTETRKLVAKEFGRSISEHTFRNHINET